MNKVEKISDYGRIYFKDNPYPLGHRIKGFEWSGRLERDSGLWFDLHLETARYDEGVGDEKEELEVKTDWQSCAAWENYGYAILSSTNWDAPAHERRKSGFLAANWKSPLNFSRIHERVYLISSVEGDEIPDINEDQEDYFKFGLYLLGHDTAADHRIQFKVASENTFRLNWSGRIANTYVGDDQLSHSFIAELPQVEFSGIIIPRDLSETDAQSLLKSCVLDHSRFELNQKGEDRYFLRRSELGSS